MDHPWNYRFLELCYSIMTRFGPASVGRFAFGPLLSRKESQRLREQYQSLNDSLLSFYCSAARSAEMSYGIALKNGGYVGTAFAFFDPMENKFHDCREWGDSSARHDNLATLANLFAFCEIDNGDLIGLDMRASRDEPFVVYLNHDTLEGYPIAKNFEAFMIEWEHLCYLDPLELREMGCINSDGFLDHTAGPAKAISTSIRGPLP